MPLVKQPKPDECPTLHAIAAATGAQRDDTTLDKTSTSAEKKETSADKKGATESDQNPHEAPPLDFTVGSKMYVVAEGKY